MGLLGKLMSTPPAATGPRAAEELGMTLALDEERATVSCDDRLLAPGVLLEHLQLELAEVNPPLQLDGGASIFQDRATRLVSGALRLSTEVLARRVRQALWSQDVPLAELKATGEGDHLVLEGRYGRRRAPVLYHVVVAPDEDVALQLLFGPLLAFEMTEPSTGPLLGKLVQGLGNFGRGPSGLDGAVRARSPTAICVDALRPALWRLLPYNGWKMPLLDNVRIEAVELEQDHIRLRFGLGRPFGLTHAARRALQWEQEARQAETFEQLNAKGLIIEAFQDLNDSLPDGFRHRAMEYALSDSRTHDRILALARSDAIPDLLYSAVVHHLRGHESEARVQFDRAAALLRSSGHQRAAGWALLPNARSMDLERRVGRLEDAVALRPDDTEVLAELVDALPRLGRKQAAVRAARRLVRVASDPVLQVEGLRAAGRILREDAKELSGARRSFEAALQLMPGDDHLMEELAVTYGLEGHHASALELMDRVIRKARGEGDTRRTSRLQVQAARLWAESGEPRRAVDQFRTAYDLDPANYDALVGYFQHAGAADVLTSARTFWNGIESSLPDHGADAARVYLAAGRLFVAQDRNLARQILARARRADPRNPGLLDATLEFEGDPEALPLEAWLDAIDTYFARSKDDEAFRILAMLVERGVEDIPLRRWIEQAHEPERLRRLAGCAELGGHAELELVALDRAVTLANSERRAEWRAVRAMRACALGDLPTALNDATDPEVSNLLAQERSIEARALTLAGAARKGAWQAAEKAGEYLRGALGRLAPAWRMQVVTDWARALSALRKPSEQASVLREALAAEPPNSPQAHRLRGLLADAYRLMGDREGLAELRRQQAEQPETPEGERALLLMEAARVARAAGENQQALKDAEGALAAARRASPDLEHRATRLLNELLEERTPSDRVDVQARRAAVEAGTVRERLVLERAQLLVAEDRVDEAVAVLSSAMSEAPASHRISAALGALCERLGHVAHAADAFGQASRRADRAGQAATGALHAVRAADLYLRVNDLKLTLHYDRAALSLAAVSGEGVDLTRSLQRLEEVAREDDDHETLVDLLERRAERTTDAERLSFLFERAQILALALNRKNDAIASLQDIPRDRTFGRSILECWSAWAAEIGVDGPPWTAFDELVGFVPANEDRVWAWVHAASALMTEERGRASALARLEAAHRLDPDNADVRRLRRQLVSQSADPVQKAEAYVAEAERAHGSGADRSQHWVAAGESYLVAAERDLDASYRDRARRAFANALETADRDVAIRVAAATLKTFPALALEAIALVERRSADNEQRWACRIVRAWLELEDGSNALVQSRMDRAWDLMERLDLQLLERYVAELGAGAELGTPEDQVLSIALECAASTPDPASSAEQLTKWTQRKLTKIKDPWLRAHTSIACAEALVARGRGTDEAVLALVAELDGATLPFELRDRTARILVALGRLDELVQLLGLSFGWAAMLGASKDVRIQLSEVMARHLPLGSDAWGYLLLETADEGDDEHRTEMLRRVAQHGSGTTSQMALERLETWSNGHADLSELAEDQRRRAEEEPDDVRRASLRAQLGETHELRMGDASAAESEYRAALALDPRCEVAVAGLQRLLVSQDRFEELASELGSERLEQVRSQLVHQKSIERAVRATEAHVALHPDQESSAWMQLAEAVDPEDERKVSLLARAARGEHGPESAETVARAVDMLWSLYRHPSESRRDTQLAELLSSLLNGPRRAQLLLDRVDAGCDDETAELLLREAAEEDPEHSEIRLRLARVLARQARFDDLVRALPKADVEAFVGADHEGSSLWAEGVLEARARMQEGPEASRDWLRAARHAWARRDGPTSWRRLGEAMRASDSVEGAPELLGELILEAPEVPLPEMQVGPRTLLSVLDRLSAEDSVPPASWALLTAFALRAGGVDGLVQAVEGRPDRVERVAEALQARLLELDELFVEVRVALARLRPRDAARSAWLEEAFERASTSARDRLPDVAPLWLEVQLANPDPEAQRRAIDQVRALDANLGGPDVLLASLLVELRRGRFADARTEADALFDSDAVPPGVRREAAHAVIHVFRDSKEPEALAILERAWVELCRPETVSENERTVGLRALADIREARGADPAEIAQPLEAVIGLGMLEAEEAEVRRRLRELWEQAGDWARAEVHQTALAEVTQSASDWVLAAELRTWLSDLDGADRAVAEALRIDPTSDAALGVRFRLAEHAEAWDEAIEALLAWAPRAPEPDEEIRRLHRALELAVERRPDRIREVALRVLEAVQDDRIDGLLTKMQSTLLSVTPTELDEILLHALDEWSNPRQAGMVRLSLVKRLDARGEVDLANTVLEHGITSEIDPGHPLLTFALDRWNGFAPEAVTANLGDSSLGQFLLRHHAERAERDGRVTDAVAAWRRALEMPSMAKEAALRLARLEASTNAERADVAAMAEQEPERVLDWVQDGGLRGSSLHFGILSSMGRWSEVADRLRERANESEDREKVESLLLLARVCWERLGAFGRAVSSIGEACQLQPGFRLLRQATDLAVAAGCTDEAKDHARALLERLGPSDGRRDAALLGLAGAMLAAGDEAGAQALIPPTTSSDILVQFRVALMLSSERWADAERALAQSAVPTTRPDAVAHAFQRLAARLWIATDQLGDRTLAERLVGDLDNIPTVEPPFAVHMPWVLSVARRLGRTWPEAGAALLLGHRRITGWTDQTCLAELLFRSDRDSVLLAELSDQGPRGAVLPWLARAASRGGRSDAADLWAEERQRTAADPSCSASERSAVLRAWAEFQPSPSRASTLTIADWLAGEVTPLEDDVDALERGGLWSDAKAVLERVFLDPAMPEQERRRALERWRTMAEEDRPAALEVLQSAEAHGGPILKDILHHTCAMARRLDLAAAELDALERLAELSSEHEQCQYWLRMVVLLEDREPSRAASILWHVIDREGPKYGWLLRLARLYRRCHRPSDEAALWARFGGSDPAALSRVAVIRSRELDDRRGALAAWRVAAKHAPEELSFRWGVVTQSATLGAFEDAIEEADSASQVARALLRHEAAAAFAMEALRLRAEHGSRPGVSADDLQDEVAAWKDVLQNFHHILVVLDKAVARARTGGPAAEIVQELENQVQRVQPGPVRGRLRVAAARICERVLGRASRGAGLRAQAAQEDFPEGSSESGRDAPGATIPPLETRDIGVSKAFLELTGRIDELVRRGEERAVGAHEPDVKCQVWLEVARFHQARRHSDASTHARRALNRAVQADPLSVEAWAELALVELASEDWTGARRSLERLDRLGGPPWVLGELELRAARVAQLLGDPAGANDWLKRSSEKDRGGLGPLRGAVEVARDHLDPQHQVEPMERLRDALDPVLDADERARLDLELAKLMVGGGAFAPALEAIDEALILRPDLPGARHVKAKVLQAAQAPSSAVARAKLEAALVEPEADLADGLDAALALGDEQAVHRIARRLNEARTEDGLGKLADHWRQRGAWERFVPLMERLGGLDQVADPSPEELAGWIRTHARAGRPAEVFRRIGATERLDAVLEALPPTQGHADESRFWLASLAESLDRQERSEPQVRKGLEALCRRFADHALMRVLADADRLQDGPSPRVHEIYQELLVQQPWDLRLLETWTDMSPDPRGPRWARSFLAQGVAQPQAGLPDQPTFWDRASAWLGEDVTAQHRRAFEQAVASAEGSQRDEVSTLSVESADFGEIGVVRHYDPNKELTVHIGRQPCVWVPWMSHIEQSPEAIRFLAASELAFRVIPDRRLADAWALGVVPDLRAAADALGRWGLGKGFVPLDDPRARTDIFRSVPRLADLLRVVAGLS
ncbi:MAG: hypothetical protein ACFB9M_05190 [Myxococcota bacterium]